MLSDEIQILLEDLQYHSATNLNVASHLERFLAKAKALESQVTKLRSDIQCMVDKAAQEHLPAYREQQTKIMRLEDEIKRLNDLAGAGEETAYRAI